MCTKLFTTVKYMEVRNIRMYKLRPVLLTRNISLNSDCGMNIIIKICDVFFKLQEPETRKQHKNSLIRLAVF